MVVVEIDQVNYSLDAVFVKDYSDLLDLFS